MSGSGGRRSTDGASAAGAPDEPILIRPGVHCENLASQILGRCARQVPADFERRYGLRPWLLESFVDGSHYDGACYKAAIGSGSVGPRGAGATGSGMRARVARTSICTRWWRTCVSGWG